MIKYSCVVVCMISTAVHGIYRWQSIVGPSSDIEKVVAFTLLSEADGEGNDGLYAVACVIQQRMIECGLTAEQICLGYKQFSSWNRKKTLSNTDFGIYGQVPYAFSLARALIAGEPLQREQVLYANHYHTKKVHPAWSRHKKPVKTIKNHLFFKLHKQCVVGDLSRVKIAA